MSVLDEMAEKQGIDLNEIPFKATRAILPYRCKMSGNVIWPGSRIYVGKLFRRDPDNNSTLIIERVKLSDAEYMLHQLTGKAKEEYNDCDSPA